jgi:D-proline reductase (dithiol) PrdB
MDRVPQLTRNLLLTRAVEVNQSTPWASAPVLAEATVALVTSAGVHRRDDHPFVVNDASYRVIASSAEAGDLLQSHSSLGFDRTAAIADINVTVPIDRLREMVADGTIGALGPHHYSFMGAQRDVAEIRDSTSIEVAERLCDERVDIALLTPT